MRKLTLLSGLVMMSGLLYADGLKFTSGTWKETLAKAKKEHKLIYMDIYTTWCGPCKMMAAQVFPDDKAGAKYNSLFVNYKIDAEKGEGLELAKKYQVKGYPTNLYIDPADESVVYRVLGSTDVDGFVTRADNAILEQKDPMKWNDYEAKLATGNNDQQFLKAYLEKADRLDMPNDAALNAYVSATGGQVADMAALKFLVTHTKTLDNKAVSIIAAQRDKLKSVFRESPDYFQDWSKGLAYGTLEKAVANKDERLLDLIEKSADQYNIDLPGVSGMYYFRTQYYKQTGDKDKAWTATQAEANYLLSLTDRYYGDGDAAAFRATRTALLSQLKASGVAEDAAQVAVEDRFRENPDMRRSLSASAAAALNEMAWNVVEKKPADKAAVKAAMAWSGKSLALIPSSTTWPMYADTYAHLLMLNGERDKAIGVQEKAIAKAKEYKSDLTAELEQSLEEMKKSK